LGADFRCDHGESRILSKLTDKILITYSVIAFHRTRSFTSGFYFFDVKHVMLIFTAFLALARLLEPFFLYSLN
jgi:hypothetical protein